MNSLNFILKNGTNFIAIVAVVATLTYKYGKHSFKREPAGGSLLIDYYEAKPRMMIPEYNRSLMHDTP